MVKDYKTKSGARPSRAKPAAARRSAGAAAGPSRLRWFAGGLVVGVVASIVVLEGPYDLGDVETAASRWLAGQSARTPATGAGESQASPRKPRFEFYTLLPEMEVAVPEEELIAATRPSVKPPPKPAETATAAGASPPAAPATTEAPEPAARYILQVGSFRRVDEAEKLKANLALLGVEASIQSVDVNGDETWHRVRVGPFSNVNRLGAARTRLRENQIEAMVLRIKR